MVAHFLCAASTLGSFFGPICGLIFGFTIGRPLQRFFHNNPGRLIDVSKPSIIFCVASIIFSMKPIRVYFRVYFGRFGLFWRRAARSIRRSTATHMQVQHNPHDNLITRDVSKRGMLVLTSTGDVVH